NLIGLWTVLLLWGMHISAKLNVFFGVRNLNLDFIPARLDYLTSFFKQRPMNPFFPISVTMGTLLTLSLIALTLRSEPESGIQLGYLLIATLSALAVLEHWLMVLPINFDRLWRWSLKPDSLSASNKPKNRLTSKPACKSAEVVSPR
ncbi:MAG: DUF3623 family protein, partial [Pseudomonadota bacterium]